MWNSSEGMGKPNSGYKALISHTRTGKCKKLKCNQYVRGCLWVSKTLSYTWEVNQELFTDWDTVLGK